MFYSYNGGLTCVRCYALVTPEENEDHLVSLIKCFRSYLVLQIELLGEIHHVLWKEN